MSIVFEKPIKFDYIERPGEKWSDEEREKAMAEIYHIAELCFDEMPKYQCLVGTKEELSRVIITTAKDREGKIMGFVSSVLLEVEGVGNVLHLGLTCVHPKARKGGLTHKLLTHLISTYLLRNSPLRSIWISNCACVVSSLGNVAMHFEQIYPSPFFAKPPSDKHKIIAKAISENYRDPIAVNPEAEFEEEKFIFRGSVRDTVFAKTSDDKRYHHRRQFLTNYYLKLMNIDDGDEVLQIGRIGLGSYPKYMLKRLMLAWKKPRIESLETNSPQSQEST